MQTQTYRVAETRGALDFTYLIEAPSADEATTFFKALIDEIDTFTPTGYCNLISVEFEGNY